MTVCGIKHADGVCVMGKCPYFKKCCPHYWLERKSESMTEEEWLRSATFEELAGAIYEWHTKGYARGRLEVDLNPITEVVEWLKQPHTTIKE